MFFVFHILILLSYVNNTNNFVLKRLNHGVTRNINQKENSVIWQDSQNNLYDITTPIALFEIKDIVTDISSPNLKVNMFDKRLSDEMLSIRQNIYGSHISTKYESQENNTEPTLQFQVKQKWPSVELKSDESRDNNVDFDILLSEKKLNIVSYADVPIKRVDRVIKKNQTKNKVVDLRSLSDVAPDDRSNLRQSVTVDQCSCSRSSINSHKCGGCTRTSVSFSLMPFYLPYEPYYISTNIPNFYYPVNNCNEDSRDPLEEDLYYYEKERECEKKKRKKDKERDSGGRHHGKKKKYYYYVDQEHDSETYSDDVDVSEESQKKKNKNCKMNKLTTDDNINPSGAKEKFNTVVLNNDPNFVKDLINDLSMLYPSSVISNCYCSSSSHNILVSHIALILFIFSDVVVKVLLVE